jgi:hypothetical protein
MKTKRYEYRGKISVNGESCVTLYDKLLGKEIHIARQEYIAYGEHYGSCWIDEKDVK